MALRFCSVGMALAMLITSGCGATSTSRRHHCCQPAVVASAPACPTPGCPTPQAVVVPQPPPFAR